MERSGKNGRTQYDPVVFSHSCTGLQENLVGTFDIIHVSHYDEHAHWGAALLIIEAPIYIFRVVPDP